MAKQSFIDNGGCMSNPNEVMICSERGLTSISTKTTGERDGNDLSLKLLLLLSGGLTRPLIRFRGKNNQQSRKDMKSLVYTNHINELKCILDTNIKQDTAQSLHSTCFLIEEAFCKNIPARFSLWVFPRF